MAKPTSCLGLASARLAARAKSGGACNVRKASSASVKRVDDSYAIPAGSAVRLQDRRESNSGDPCLQIIDVPDHLGLRSANALCLSQLYKSASRIDDWETFGCAEGMLNQRAKGSSFRRALFSAVQMLQVPGCKVVPRNNDVRLCGGDRRCKRRQRRQAVVNMMFDAQRQSC